MYILHPQRHPFSRSYGVNLPNSLTKVLPFALVSSTHPPVSVCGTGTHASSLRGFSWQLGSTTSACASPSRLDLRVRIYLYPSSAYTFGPPLPSGGLAYLAASPLRSAWVVPEY